MIDPSSWRAAAVTLAVVAGGGALGVRWVVPSLAARLRQLAPGVPSGRHVRSDDGTAVAATGLLWWLLGAILVVFLGLPTHATSGWGQLCSIPVGAGVGVGLFAAAVMLEGIVAGVPMPNAGVRPARLWGRGRGAARGRPAAPRGRTAGQLSAAGSTWLGLTRSGWLLRYRVVAEQLGWPLAVLLIALEFGGQEATLRMMSLTGLRVLGAWSAIALGAALSVGLGLGLPSSARNLRQAGVATALIAVVNGVLWWTTGALPAAIAADCTFVLLSIV